MIICLMPMYNTASYIIETLESFVSAKEHSKEDVFLIVCDDKSTDNSLNLVKNFARERKDIIILENEVNKGLIFTRENLVLFALENLSKTGIFSHSLNHQNYFSFMDSDDLLTTNKFTDQVNHLNKNKELVAVGGNMVFFSEDKSLLFEANINPIFKIRSSFDEMKVESLFKSPVFSGMLLFREQYLRDITAKNKKGFWATIAMGEDWEWFVTNMKDYKIENIPENVMFYRRHQKNMTSALKDNPFSPQSNIRSKAFSYINMKLTEEEQLLHLSISPCRFWNINELSYFQNNKPNLLEKTQVWFEKIKLNNQKANFYNKEELESQTNEILIYLADNINNKDKNIKIRF